MAFRLGKLGFVASPGTYSHGVRPLKIASRNFSYAKLRSLTLEETKLKLKNLAKRTWDGLGTRRCAWFTGSSVGCSAVSRVEPPARGGTGGRWVRTSPLGVTTRGISTPIGCRSSGQLSIGGLRLLSSSSSQTVKEKARKFEKLKIFVRNEWKNMDFRSKFTVLELIAKFVLLGFGGGWGLMLAYSVIDRVDKSEEVVKKLTEAIEKMQVQLIDYEERSDKHRADIDAKYEQLRLEINELRSFKDLWVAFAFERETSSVAVPSTPETK